MADEKDLNIEIKVKIDQAQSIKDLESLQKELKKSRDEAKLGSDEYISYNKGLQDLDKTIDKAAKDIGVASKATNGLGAAFKSMAKDALPASNKAFGELNTTMKANPILGIIAAVLALVGVFKEIGDLVLKNNTIFEFFNQTLAGVEAGISAIANLKNPFTAFTNGKEAAKQFEELEIEAGKVNETMMIQGKIISKSTEAYRDHNKTQEERIKAAKAVSDAYAVEGAAQKKLADDTIKATLKKSNVEASYAELVGKSYDDKVKIILKEGKLLPGQAAVIAESFDNAKILQDSYDDEGKKARNFVEADIAADTKEKNKESESTAKEHAEELKSIQEASDKEFEKLSEEFLTTDRQKLEKGFTDKLATITGDSKEELDLIKAIKKKMKTALDDFDKKEADKKYKEHETLIKGIKKDTDIALKDKEEAVLNDAKVVTDGIKDEIEETNKKYANLIKAAAGHKDKIAELEAEKNKELKGLRSEEEKAIKNQAQAQVDADTIKAKSEQDNIAQTLTDELKAINDSTDDDATKQDAKAAAHQKADAAIALSNQTLAGQTKKLEQDTQKAISDLDAQTASDKLANIKKEKDARLAAEKEAFDTAKGLMSALNDLNDLFSELQSQKRNQTKAQEEKAAKEQFKIKKGLGIVSAAISTSMAIAAQLEGLPETAPLLALAAATGAIQIATIAAKKYTPGQTSGGSGASVPSIPSGGSGGSGQSAPSVQSGLGASSMFGLGQAQVPSAASQQAQQVFVTTTSINNAQSKVNVTSSRSKIG